MQYEDMFLQGGNPGNGRAAGGILVCGMEESPLDDSRGDDRPIRATFCPEKPELVKGFLKSLKSRGRESRLSKWRKA